MKKAIGIDLGTTNSAVAIRDTAVKIIRNKEDEEMTRSCVALRNDEFYVGQTAYQLFERDPVNTVLSIKRLMGGAIDDKMVQEMKNNSYYKFGITNLKGGTDDAVAVVLGGKQFTPEQISSEILKKLKKDAEEKLGDEVTHAVITVPAYFTEKQKNATRIAAQLAGFKVQKLLPEPTAAAIAYGVENVKSDEGKTVLIYDFGGGTFDLSILNIVDGQYLEAGTGGDRWLGGDDLDKILYEIIYEKVSAEYRINDIQSLVKNLPRDKRFKFEAQLRYQSENAKKTLSSANSAYISIPSILEDEEGEWIDIDIDISREDFENAIRPLISRSIELIESLFSEVGYDSTMIDNILLVGGTSRIPIVKEMLCDKYGIDKVKVTERPMLAIAEGAAILSHRMGDEYEPNLQLQQNISEISYSTNHNYYVELENDYDLVIEKQLPMPVNVLRTYSTSMNNQKVIKVALYAKVEDGEMERQTIGFVAIEENLPIGSEIVFDITLGIDEIFEIKVYTNENRSSVRPILLGRGHKDSKALSFLSDSLEKILTSEFSENQRNYFLNVAQTEIESINRLGEDSADSEKWEQIGTNVFSALEQAERVSDDIDEDKLVEIFGQIILAEYTDLIGAQEENSIRSWMRILKNSDDALERIQAIQQLKIITDEYHILITLYTVKITSDKAAKINATDANRLLQLHDQIFIHFKNRESNEGFALLDEAIEIRDKYGVADIAPASIRVKKN